MIGRERFQNRVPQNTGAKPAPKPAGPPQAVTFACGHTAQPHKKARDPAGVCNACRVKAHQEREAQQQAEAPARRAARAAVKRKRREDAENRLPHDSRFEVWYDAVTKTWSGTLTVPGATPDSADEDFKGSASGVFRLLEKLDRMYRTWAGQGGK